MRWLYALGFWLALAGLAVAEERHLHTYTMHRALPEQVLPALSAQLSEASSITPYQQQLILNVTDREYRTLLELLGQLDVAPRSLLISVRNRNQSSAQDSGYSVDGRVGSGNVQVQTGRNVPRNGARIEVGQNSRQGSGDGSQQVRAVEGSAAYIDAGNVFSMRVDRYGNRERVPVTSGFYATARLVGDEVVVDIDQHDDRIQSSSLQARNLHPQGIQTQGVQTQAVQTQVRGRVGSWIPLGALQSNRSDSSRGIAAYGDTGAASSTDLAIKVDLAD